MIPTCGYGGCTALAEFEWFVVQNYGRGEGWCAAMRDPDAATIEGHACRNHLAASLRAATLVPRKYDKGEPVGWTVTPYGGGE